MNPTQYLSRLVLLLSVVFTISACEKGNGVMVTQTFTIADFDKINLQRHADVYITQGSPQSVSIEAEENLMDLITTNVVNGEWIIDFQKTVTEYETMTILITMPNVNSVKVTDGSGGDIFLENVVQADSLVVALSGDGSITGKVNVANRLTTTLEGSGNITLSGQAGQHLLNTSGAGLVAAYALVANTGEVRVGGTGDAQVRYTGAWDAYISGAGNIKYKVAAPANTTITGTGTVSMVP